MSKKPSPNYGSYGSLIDRKIDYFNNFPKLFNRRLHHQKMQATVPLLSIPPLGQMQLTVCTPFVHHFMDIHIGDYDYSDICVGGTLRSEFEGIPAGQFVEVTIIDKSTFVISYDPNRLQPAEDGKDDEFVPKKIIKLSYTVTDV